MSEAGEPEGEPLRNRLASRLRRGGTVFSAWSGLPEPLVAELLARAGYDAVTLDMQHGYHDTDSVLRGIAAVQLAGKPALVRIPVGRFDMASRALDFGAQAVVAPMINSVADATAFAAAMKFPPLGERSWGPHRAVALHDYQAPADYLANANRDTLAIAMVETRAAQGVLDEILSLDGIDGVLVGPSDFSIAWSHGKAVSPLLDDMMPAIGDIAARASAAGKIACVFAMTSDIARRYEGMGYRLIALSTDSNCLTAGASALLSAVRG